MKILCDKSNPKAVKLNDVLRSRMDEGNRRDETYIVLGGDGFMLQSIRSHYSPDAVFLGLNCGSIGFLLNDVPENIDHLTDILRRGRYTIRQFPRIQMEADDLDGRAHHAAAINDIYLERMTSQTCHLRLAIDGITVVEKLVCDGVILSTALGSTAYNYSAAGPVCHPSLETICVTPICPHSPRLSPVVLSLTSTITMEVLSPDKRLAQAVADGVAIHRIARLKVAPCGENVRLAFLQGHDYTSAMIHKVLRV